MRGGVTSARGLRWILAVVALSAHLLFAGSQGYFSDETYFIDCSRHLDFGYFDLAPLLPLLVRLSRALGGPSLLALRFLPALGHAGTIWTGLLIAEELGGGLFAQALTGLCLMGAPGFVLLGSLFLSPSLEPFFWTLITYLFLRLIGRGRTELWPGIGVLVGVGILYRPSLLFHVAGLGFGLVAARKFHFLVNRRFAAGAGVAALLIAPTLVWQATHAWNMLVFAHSVADSTMVRNIGASAFLLAPVLALNPICAPLWIGGWAYLTAAKRMRPYRAVAGAYVFSVATLWLFGGKAYYLAGAYPALLAAGAVGLEALLARWNPKSRLPQVALLALFAMAGAALAPAGLPILGPEATDRYLDSLGALSISRALQLIGIRRDTEGSEREQLLRDLVAVQTRLAREGGPAERVLTAHYFQASWINVLGPSYGLPAAVSGSNSYYLWGPGPGPVESAVAVGFSAEDLSRWFGKVEITPENPELAVVRAPRRPFAEIWPELKSYPFP